MLKRIILALIIILWISKIELFAEPHRYFGLRCDRMLHFGGGYGMAMPLSMWSDKYFEGLANPDKYGAISIGFPLLVGYMKEVYDQNTFNFIKWGRRKPADRHDPYWDFVAVGLGAICGKFMTYTF